VLIPTLMRRKLCLAGTSSVDILQARFGRPSYAPFFWTHLFPSILPHLPTLPSPPPSPLIPMTLLSSFFPSSLPPPHNSCPSLPSLPPSLFPFPHPTAPHFIPPLLPLLPPPHPLLSYLFFLTSSRSANLPTSALAWITPRRCVTGHCRTRIALIVVACVETRRRNRALLEQRVRVPLSA